MVFTWNMVWAIDCLLFITREGKCLPKNEVDFTLCYKLEK